MANRKYKVGISWDKDILLVLITTVNGLKPAFPRLHTNRDKQTKNPQPNSRQNGLNL